MVGLVGARGFWGVVLGVGGWSVVDGLLAVFQVASLVVCFAIWVTCCSGCVVFAILGWVVWLFCGVCAWFVVLCCCVVGGGFFVCWCVGWVTFCWGCLCVVVVWCSGPVVYLYWCLVMWVFFVCMLLWCLVGVVCGFGRGSVFCGWFGDGVVVGVVGVIGFLAFWFFGFLCCVGFVSVCVSLMLFLRIVGVLFFGCWLVCC